MGVTERTWGVAIVGCGLVGRKRAMGLGAARLVACADLVIERAQALADSVERLSPAGSRTGARVVATDDWQKVICRPDVDLVVVATTNDALAEVTLAAVRAGKPVMVEKPGARNVRELAQVMEAARRSRVPVRVGFNHRYHPALKKAREIFETGALGEMMFVRGRYGHGGRIGYEKEWRADPALSGGGELLDQGVHLIDLARWFLGDFQDVSGFAHTYYWPMPVEDNGFMLLKTARQQVAFLHVSCTEWKNLFSLEIYGRQAKLHVEGLGGSYGVERLSYYRMLPQMGPPDTEVWEYPGENGSWSLEMADFLDDLRLGREPSAGLADAHAALVIVEQIYKDCGHDHHA